MIAQKHQREDEERGALIIYLAYAESISLKYIEGVETLLTGSSYIFRTSQL